jgi:hypothetical protein
MKQGTTEQIVFKFEAGESVDVTDKTPKEVEEIVKKHGNNYVIYHLRTKIGGVQNE